MTRKEVQTLLMSIQTAYPKYKPVDKTATIDLWYAMLKRYSYHEVKGALEAYIYTDKRNEYPGIGQLIEKLQTTTQPAELNEMKAWDLVAKAISNGIYHSEREFNKLPPLVQKAVGSAGTIRAWAMSPSDAHNVMQSNFMKTYRTVLFREKEQAKLPPELRQITEKTFEALDEVKPKEDIEPKQEEVSVPEWVTEKLKQGIFA